MRSRKFGGTGVGETPLPIPNREVKPHSADGTCPLWDRESRSPPVYSLLSSRPARLEVVKALRVAVELRSSPLPASARGADVDFPARHPPKRAVRLEASRRPQHPRASPMAQDVEHLPGGLAHEEAAHAPRLIGERVDDLVAKPHRR